MSSISSSTSKKQETKSLRHRLAAGTAQIAIFGDSAVAVLVSFVVLVIALGVAWHVNDMDDATAASTTTIHRPKQAYSTEELLGPIPEIDPMPRIYNVADLVSSSTVGMLPNVTSEMVAEYERDGVICVRGLLSQELLERLDVETRAFIGSAAPSQPQNDSSQMDDRRRESRRGRGMQFHTVEHSAMFHHQNNYDSNNNTNETSHAPTSLATIPSALMQAALWSDVPAFAARLLNVTAFIEQQPQQHPSSSDINYVKQQPRPRETLRVIRDIFLAKDDDAFVCGWHVDDLGFWPATPESPHGINAWIALDDMEFTAQTGGFALAVQSHVAPWREAAYYWTGAATNFPSATGYDNASHMFAHRTGQGTCNLERVAPHIHRRMEATKRVYPVKRGDVIFHTRWLFHRTIAVDRRHASTSSNRDEDDNAKRVYRRYSIRYGPGSSTVIPPGFGTEPSVLWDAVNGGRTADEVNANDGPWYPQAWPPMTLEETSPFWTELDRLVVQKMPVAQRERELRIREMKPHLQRLAQDQRKILNGRT